MPLRLFLDLPARVIPPVAFERHHGSSEMWERDMLNAPIEDAQSAAAKSSHASILDACPDLVCILDLDGRLERVNHEGRCVLGMTHLDHLRGAPWTSMWPIEVRPQAAAAVTAGAVGRQTRFQAGCPTSMGINRRWDTIVTPIRDGCGQVIQVLATSRDITELHERVSTVAPLHDAVGLETIRHDLLTPLHGMLGMAALLRDTVMTAAQRAMLETIQECGETLKASLTSADGDASTCLTDAAACPSIGRSSTVLVVDDNRVNRELLRLAFDALGATITTAENGAEACDLCETEIYDLIVMDLHMPVMDGLTAIRRIRDRETRHASPRTPVVVFTASGLEECERASRAAGADGFLTKPLSTAALISTVSPILDGREAVRRAGASQH